MKESAAHEKKHTHTPEETQNLLTFSAISAGTYSGEPVGGFTVMELSSI